MNNLFRLVLLLLIPLSSSDATNTGTNVSSSEHPSSYYLSLCSLHWILAAYPSLHRSLPVFVYVLVFGFFFGGGGEKPLAYMTMWFRFCFGIRQFYNQFLPADKVALVSGSSEGSVNLFEAPELQILSDSVFFPSTWLQQHLHYCSRATVSSNRRVNSTIINKEQVK